MQALTRLNPTDPVRFDGMNTILGEIEGRDEDLLNKINVLNNTAYTTKTDYFVQGETVLDFAIKNSNSTKFVVAGITPSDLPISAEGWVSVESEIPSLARKRVVFKPYLNGRYEYYREIFSGEWRTEWRQVITDTVLNERGYLTSKHQTRCNDILENGVYTIDPGDITSPNSNWAFTLHVIKREGYHNCTQLAIAYFPVSRPVMYIRMCINGAWGEWKEICDTEKAFLTLLEGLTQGQWCSNIVNKVGNTLTFRLNFYLPSNWSGGRVIFYLPDGMRPTEVIHMLDDQNLVSLDITQSGACVLYGGIAGQQYVFNKSTVI